MKELRDAIEKFGRAVGKDIVKVDMLLNHRIDTKLVFQMGEAFAEKFRTLRPTIILTVEASGIAIAMAAAHALGDLPVVFAKKGSNVVQSDDVAQARVYSFTHKKENIIRVDKHYLPYGSRVLIIDDFLADGHAVAGLMDICDQLHSTVVGVGIGVEKGFMNGGKELREKGIRLESLAIVSGIADGKLILTDE